tara:strand:- start:12818 stop:13306 length:489 start_codon:yes stop_codon:yes gene_type:complete
MIAFLMFFYFFIFVALFVAIANKKEVTVIYITTKDLTHYPNYDSDDNDEMQIDEGDSNVKHSNDNDYIQTYQIQMKTKTKDEKILYEFHSYLSEHNINEVTNIMTVEDDNILWDIKYSSNIYNKFYDSLIEYMNENFLSENLVVFLNEKKVETYSINPELVK